MYQGKIIFSQIMDHLPIHTFRRKVQQYQGNRYVKNFSCLDQYLSMAFAQLTFRESLRDIEACLRAQRSKLFHMGIRVRSQEAHWQMPMNDVTGVSMQILPWH